MLANQFSANSEQDAGDESGDGQILPVEIRVVAPTCDPSIPEFEVNLGYIAQLCLKKTTKKKVNVYVKPKKAIYILLAHVIHRRVKTNNARQYRNNK